MWLTGGLVTTLFESAATQEAIAITYAQGMASGRRGEPVDNCPYDPEGHQGRLYNAWSLGWKKERECSS